jgi:hypothetical protein
MTPSPLRLAETALRAGAPLRLLSGPRRSPSSVSPTFHQPPEPLGPGAPGELIRAEEMDAYLVPGIRIRARTWRVRYRSTAATGEPTAVSGTVLLPLGQSRRTRPLLGYAVGTHGIGDSSAPSRLLARGLDYEAGLIAMVLARGWAVAVTDYQGLGTPGDHTYMVGRALGPNVLDAMRAARALHPEELPVGGPAVVMGYSEGGAAAGWAAQLQPTYAPTCRSPASRPAPRRRAWPRRRASWTAASSRSSSPSAASATRPHIPIWTSIRT